VDTDAVAVRLYGLEPEQFTTARKQYAQTALAAGDEQSAAVMMAMRKPTLAAWLANQLVRTDPDGVHALTELGEDLRQTYVSGRCVAAARAHPAAARAFEWPGANGMRARRWGATCDCADR
jgi:hypothetical protein